VNVGASDCGFFRLAVKGSPVLSDNSQGPFRKSTRCGDNACVEVSIGDRVAVRNSAAPSKVIVFTKEEWRAFLAGVQVGEFEV
jgi:hypothetical protein